MAAGALLLFIVVQVALPGLFSAPRLALFDLYERLAPRHRDPAFAPVVIVAIDDASLKVVGEWPWPRDVQARLIRAILDTHPAALGIDVLWSEGDRSSETGGVTAAGDRALAEALRSGPVAIGVVGSQDTSVEGDTGPFPPVFFSSDPPGPVRRWLLHSLHLHPQPRPPPRLTGLFTFSTDMRSILAIDLAAAGHGLLSNDPDPDGVFRRLRLVSTVRGAVAPDLSLEVYRLAEGERSFTLYPVPSGRGLNRIAVGPPDFSTKPDPSRSTFPTEPDGSLWIDYARDPPPSFSAKDVLSGRTLPQNFDGRLVLIGLTGVGLVDQARKTPAGLMPGIEINAQGLENLIAHQLVHRQLAHRPGGARVAEATLSFVAGLFLIVALPAARGPRRVMAALAPLLALGVLGGVLWSQDRVLADVATPALGCGVVLLSLLGGGLAQLRRELELQRLAAARLEGELQAGGKIQRSLLRTRWEFDARVDLHADMVPALHTGGDFYDFVPLGSDHLFIAVGDVSGKGLHAAIFSVIGQVLGESCALRGETDIGAIVRSANAEISRNNREALFITLFAGILDLKSGELSFSNAGHDTPFLLRPGQPPAAVTGVGGPPLCVLDDFPYDTETLRLQPGDIICVTTDGVTEAMTKAGDLLGRGAVEQVLAATPPNASARDVTMALKRAVSEFVAGAEPSDDLTILTVRWRGPHPT